MVDDDVGGDDVDTAEARLVAADGDGEGLCCKGLELVLVLELDDWTSVSKWRRKVARETDRLEPCKERGRDGQSRRNSASQCSRGANGGRAGPCYIGGGRGRGSERATTPAHLLLPTSPLLHQRRPPCLVIQSFTSPSSSLA